MKDEHWVDIVNEHGGVLKEMAQEIRRLRKLVKDERNNFERAEAWRVEIAKENVKLRKVAEESNAVCVCGCSTEEHENYGEGGMGCGDPYHECIPTCHAVLCIIAKLRKVVEAGKRLRPLIVHEWSSDAAATEEWDKALRELDKDGP